MEHFNPFVGIEGNPRHLEIYWQITDLCNFNCPYCPPYLHDGRRVHRQPDITVIREFIGSLNRMIQGGKTVELNIGGGEPTVHPHISEVISMLSNDAYLIITTNGSRPIGWWKNLSRLPDCTVISIHGQSHIAKITEISEYLIGCNTEVLFNCSMDANDWERSKSAYEHFRDKFGRRAKRKVINSLDSDGNQSDPQILSLEQREYLNLPDDMTDLYPEQTTTLREEYLRKSYGNVSLISKDGSRIVENKIQARSKIIRRNMNHFNGWACSAGIESICITPAGRVLAGICGIKEIGHISSFKLADSPVICTRNTCICPGDVVITKHVIPRPTG